MDHAEADELGILEPGDQLQHARLLAPLHLRLESDQAVVRRGEIVLPQLHDRVRVPAGARIWKTDRLHRSEAQRIDAARGHHLDRQASLEELRIVELVQRRPLGRHQRAVEPVILVRGERAIQIIPFPVVHAAGFRGTGPIRVTPFASTFAGADAEFGRIGTGPLRLRPQRDARNTLDRSSDSARTIGLIAS